MEANPDIGMVSSDVNLIDGSDTIYAKLIYNKMFPIEWLLVWQNPIAHPTTFFRRSIFAGIDEVYDQAKMPAEDYDLWTRLVLKTRFRILDLPILNYRILENSAYNSNKSRAIDLSNNISYDYVKNLVDDFIEPNFLQMTEFTMIGFQHSIFKQWHLRAIKLFYYSLLESFQSRFNWTPTEMKLVKTDFLRRIDDLLYRQKKSMLIRIIMLVFIDFLSFIRYLKLKHF
jgi:hypothetical protein